jgi:hypothetical protein
MTRSANFAKTLVSYRLLPVAVLLVVPGCGPQVAREDLGKIVYEVPKVPGSDKPYPLPPLESSPAPRGPAGETPAQPAKPVSDSPASGATDD